MCFTAISLYFFVKKIALVETFSLHLNDLMFGFIFSNKIIRGKHLLYL